MISLIPGSSPAFSIEARVWAGVVFLPVVRSALRTRRTMNGVRRKTVVVPFLRSFSAISFYEQMVGN